MYLKIMLDRNFVRLMDEADRRDVEDLPENYLKTAFPYIVKDPKDIESFEDDKRIFRNAIMDVVSHMSKKGSTVISVDLDVLNQALKSESMPAKEMTVAEIEEILGHKVKIVD